MDEQQGARADLDVIEARANAATPGPWVQDEDPDGDESGLYGWLPSRDIQAVSQAPDGSVDVDFLMSAADARDAEFIAHARTDMPALLAELRAHRALEDRLRGHVDLSGHGCWVANRLAELDQALGR